MIEKVLKGIQRIIHTLINNGLDEKETLIISLIIIAVVLIVLIICNCVVGVIKASKGIFEAVGIALTGIANTITWIFRGIGKFISDTLSQGANNGPPK